MRPSLLSCHNYVISKLKRYGADTLQLYMFILETAPVIVQYMTTGHTDQLDVYKTIVYRVYDQNKWTYEEEFRVALFNTTPPHAQSTPPPQQQQPCGDDKRIRRYVDQLHSYIYLYQGVTNSKFPVHIPNSVLVNIRDHLQKYRIKEADVTLQQVLSILKVNKHVKYYDYATIIYRMLTGKAEVLPPDVVAAVQADIVRLADAAMASPDIWTLCTQAGATYVFFQLLRHNGYEYNCHTFMQAKTLSKKQSQDVACNALCDRMSWTFWPL
ncbi:replication factor [Banggai cardinalfish iridovirus]|uniref:Replication factor n=1 Tax=Banggai cardinalfish iridovirus TaxID=565290 RepID=A0A6M3QSC9_ISKNV|nr:replication factor [Banggai cardinalfish iridovirus]UWH18845.1 replication factor [Infectious spleen and kidney necrosis virus]WEP24595.1 replication factor [Largemouth bass ulcerative syndrome virus]